MSGEPYPKDKQLARGERRYRRKVASAKEWQRIVAAKQGPCRVCVRAGSNGGLRSSAPHLIEFHHLVARIHHGDDVEDNLVPLCHDHHGLVTMREPISCRYLSESLSESERGYVLRKLGPDGYARLFGVAAQ